ncbi:MAG: molybdenum cofactor guanylyltransferase [Myxococcota bacterium]
MGEMASNGDRLRNVAGAVLTGGASSRMGRDKARLAVGGVPAATRVAECLAQLCTDVVIVGGDPPSDAPGRRVPDPPGPRCALRGLVGALDACEAERVFVVATDVPFVRPSLLLALFAWPEADAVVPRSSHGLQPLVALYRREPVLEVARGHLEEERLALRHVLDAVETRLFEGEDLARVDDHGFALTNLNTPEDLAQAEAALAR